MKKLSELRTKERWLLIILSLIGVVFLSVFVKRIVGMITYEETVGKVTNVEHYTIVTTRPMMNRDRTKVTIVYHVDGSTYKVSFTEHENSSAYSIGMDKKIYYNPRRPQDAFTEMDAGMLIMTPIVLVGIVFWSFLILRRRE